MPRTPRSARRASTPTRTTEPRLAILEEEKDHQRSTSAQHRQLMREKLDYLRGLAKEIKDDDWKYDPRERLPNHVTKSQAWKPASQE